MSSDTDRAARIYVSSQMVGAVIAVVIAVGFALTLLVGSIISVVHTTTPAPTTTARSDCWDYAYGAAFPPGWSEGDAPLPSCLTDH